MKTNFSLICSLILLCSIATCVNLNGQDLAINNRETKNIKNGGPFMVKGMDQINDPEFKRMLSQFLFFDEKNDYKQLYKFLSKQHLKEFFPNVKNADEYASDMENTSERSEVKYLEITKIHYQDNQYKVEIIANGIPEGVLITIKTTLFFIKENDEWKYNGFDFNNYKELK